jgi:hypothetical protein
MEYLEAFNAAMALAEALAPKIKALAASGDISKEEQQQARDRYLALRVKGDAAFTGPGWTPSSGS